MNSLTRGVSSLLLACLLVCVVVLPGPVTASAARPHPTGFTAWQPPKPPAQRVEIGPFVFTVPNGWITWTYDEQQSERENEQTLLAQVEQIDPALVEDAVSVVESGVPDMIAAAFAPDAPGDELVYIALMSYGYQASLESLKLTARATPAQVIAALGFAESQQVNGLVAGLYLEEERDAVTFTGGFALPDQDRIVLLIGGADPTGWAQYGGAIQTAIQSFALHEQADETITPPVVPTAAGPQTDLRPDMVNTAQLPVLTPANPLYLYPYEFPVPGIMTGAVDLTRQPIDPLLEKIEGTDIVPPVVGFVSAAPTFAFIAQPTQGGTVGVVFAGDNYADTVLLVLCPNGEWHFADDVKWANADPAIAANLAQAGVYQVWIGSKLPDQVASGVLYVLVQ